MSANALNGVNCKLKIYISNRRYYLYLCSYMDRFNVNNTALDTSRLEKLFLENGILRTFKRNEYLVRQNDKTNHIGLVVSGTFRLTHIDTNANEWVVGYSFEDDFVCDYPSLTNKSPSTVNVQAINDSSVFLLTLDELNQFWETDMDTQRLGRQLAETMFAELYQRLLKFYCNTPEQRYLALMQRCPDLKERLPLKEIASFLGVTPETISRIRKKLLLK